MKKIYTKLIVIVLQLVLAVSVVAMSSYAWMVLAGNPAAEGIQITIGGGNTILVAADVSETVGGVTYHYPGAFSDTLNFGQNKGYEYLNTVGALTPVSTADGLNWFIPEYYDPSDPEVQSGAVLSGTMRSIQEFSVDQFLEHANLSAEEEKLIREGSYIYLDFWVVSPGQDYTLRISTDINDDSGGSFVMDLPDVVEAGDSYTLSSGSSGAAACVRVGLLTNSDDLIDDTMLHYQNSIAFNEMYRKLRGAYTEPNSGWQVYSSDYRFTIYEPNGDTHNGSAANGTYVVTSPIGLVNGTARLMDISDRLTVQLSSLWTMAQIGSGTQLEQRLQTALLEPAFSGLSAEAVTAKFYNDYLAGQVTPYVTTGLFVKNTANLYTAAAGGTVLDSYLTGENRLAGATDDVYIVKLEKNVPQRIRMFVWLEGQDVDCVNGVSASSFALRIELAGSNMEDSD